ncbi:MAG: hypothetical protein EON58_03205 [Alphaproteobacteria bacterium]|nr:MAG: hypothetical protein EON58_03205 [Alphaproteobacteria bacterium]
MKEYLTPRFVRLPGPNGSIELLTASMVIRRLSYTPAQLFLLAQFHGFALPIDVAPRRAVWRADEIEKWRLARDAKLASELM